MSTSPEASTLCHEESASCSNILETAYRKETKILNKYIISGEHCIYLVSVETASISSFTIAHCVCVLKFDGLLGVEGGIAVLIPFRPQFKQA